MEKRYWIPPSVARGYRRSGGTGSLADLRDSRLAAAAFRSFLPWLLFLLALAAFAPLAGAADPALPEYKVKAGYLYNFAKFVGWPAAASSNATFRIGIVDDGKVYPNMEAVLSGKKVNGRPVELLHNAPDDEMKTCHILFITRSVNKRAGNILETLGTAPVLTVGESDRFAHNGGRINFVVKEDSVRLEINLVAAEAAGLKISSELASLATIVNPQR